MSDAANTVGKLKELLFDKESAALAELARRVELLAQSQHTSQNELRSHIDHLRENMLARADLAPSVSELLDEIIVAAEIDKHEQVASAMSPLVVRTVRQEIDNSQDRLIEVMYPATGRMVQAYVKSAINEMMAKINRGLEASPFMLRVRSVISGRPAAELALADAEKLECDELFLIRRGSGSLIARWPQSLNSGNSDAHIGSVLSAINDFASHAMSEDGGNIRCFDVDDFTVYLRASPMHLLAAKCRGTPPPNFDRIIDGEFIEVTESLGRSLTGLPAANDAGDPPGSGGTPHATDTVGPNTLLPHLAERIDLRVNEAREELARAGLPVRPLTAVLVLIGLPLLAAIGWFAYTTYEVERTRWAVQDVIDSSPALNGWPVNFEVGHRGQSVQLRGLAPSSAVKSTLFSRLQDKRQDLAIRDSLTVLPTPPRPIDPEPRIAEVRQSVSALQDKIVLDSVRRSLERAERRLAEAGPDLARLSQLNDSRQRAVAARTDASVKEATVALNTVADRIRADNAKAELVQTSRDDMGAIAAKLGDASGLLAGLLSDTPVARAPTAPATPDDPMAAAENLALYAERLATVAAATVQATSIRIPEPAPPPPPPPEPTARQLLETFAKSNAIFFSESDNYRSEGDAERAMSGLVALMQGNDLLVRVIGYTDEQGSPAQNGPLALSRATKVVGDLTGRGIDASRLVAVGRANGRDLSPDTGPLSPNRRVEFEVGFAGERARPSQ
jgi:outer membrane protein OmpA-like peptidoglycan-associated protein